MKAKAKHDVKVLMEDNRFSNFLKGKEYRCMKCGYKTDMKSFDEDFEIV